MEIAIVTTLTSLDVKDALGGHVAGALISGGNSYITYQWSNPSKDVVGKYQCSVYGMDSQGHSVSHSTSLVIESVDLGVLLNKLQTLENNQDILISNNNKTSTELEKTKTQLNETKTQLNVKTSELHITQNQLRNTSGTLTQTNITLGQVSSDFAKFKNLFNMLNDPSLFVSYSPHQNHMYALSPSMGINITTFTKFCNDLGGYLVEINDLAEYDFLVHFVTKTIAWDGIMVGGTDEGHEGTWTYPSSGKPISFFNWADGNPHSSHERNCLALEAHSFMMYDVLCVRNAPNMFICEVEQT